MQLLDQGKTSEEIVRYFNHPYMTERYIEKLVARAHLRVTRRRHGQPGKRRLHTSLPREGTKMRLAWDRIHVLYVDNLAFQKAIREKGTVAVSKELGLEMRIVQNYYQRRIQGVIEESLSTHMLRMHDNRRMRAKKHPTEKRKMEQIKNLW
jgi:hypothetical protein